MGAKKIHLVGQHPPALQIDVFGVIGRERNRQQLHPSLFRRFAALGVVTGFASRDDIVPVIATALHDVIADLFDTESECIRLS